MNFLSLKGIQILTDEIINSTSTDTSDLIGPHEIDPNSTGTQAAPADEGVSWVTIVEEFLALIIIGGVIFLLFLGYLAYQKRYSDLVEEHASNPESQIKAQELTATEKEHLGQWAFNKPGSEYYLADVRAEEAGSRLGKFFKIEFLQPDDQTRTIISNKCIERNDKTVCYYEIEIDEIEVGVDIVIGLGTKASHDPRSLPGSHKESIGFHSKGGQLFVDGDEVNVYGMDATFGETIGIGYNFDSNRIYLFCNAKFLNEPPREFGSPSKSQSPSPAKSNTMKISPMKTGNMHSPEKKGTIQGAPAEITLEKSPAKENKIDLEVQKREYYPVIGATGPCKVLLNIGGAPFSIHHKEIAKGLL